MSGRNCVAKCKDNSFIYTHSYTLSARQKKLSTRDMLLMSVKLVISSSIGLVLECLLVISYDGNFRHQNTESPQKHDFILDLTFSSPFRILLQRPSVKRRAKNPPVALWDERSPQYPRSPDVPCRLRAILILLIFFYSMLVVCF